MAKRSLFDDLTQQEREEFVARLRELVDHFPTQAEAAKVAGVSVGQIKAYIAGRSAPSFLPIARLARAAGRDLNTVLPGGSPRAPVPAALDPRLFGRLLDALSTTYQELGVRIGPAELGAIAAQEYQDVAAAAAESEDEQIAMVRLVAARHRRVIQEESLASRKRGA